MNTDEPKNAPQRTPPGFLQRSVAWLALRSTPRWAHLGKDPDYRFTLANERTFLAWLRTSFATSAAAIVLHHVEPSGAPLAMKLVPICLAAFAAAMAALSFLRWRAYEIAMRLDKPLPIGMGFGTITVLATVAAGATIFWMIYSQ